MSLWSMRDPWEDRIDLGEQVRSWRPRFFFLGEASMWKHNIPRTAVSSFPRPQPACPWTSKTAMTGFHGTRPRGPWPDPARRRSLSSTLGPSRCPCAEVPRGRAILAHTPSVLAYVPTPDTGGPTLRVLPRRNAPQSTSHRNLKPKTLLSPPCKNSFPW